MLAIDHRKRPISNTAITPPRVLTAGSSDTIARPIREMETTIKSVIAVYLNIFIFFLPFVIDKKDAILFVIPAASAAEQFNDMLRSAKLTGSPPEGVNALVDPSTSCKWGVALTRSPPFKQTPDIFYGFSGT